MKIVFASDWIIRGGSTGIFSFRARQIAVTKTPSGSGNFSLHRVESIEQREAGYRFLGH